MDRLRDDRGAFFRRFPNSVVRDRDLSPEGLIILAYRATFAGRYGLNEKAVRGIVRGKAFGRDVIERGIANAIALGYLRRYQHRSAEGTWGNAVDEPVLPPAGASGNAGRI